MPILSRLSRESSISGGSEEPAPIHLLEMFRPSMDYSIFAAAVIRPYFRTAQLRRAAFATSELPLELPPGRPSLDEFFRFLQETDLNSHANHISTAAPSPASSSVGIIPSSIPFVPLAGFISGKHLDTFVWTGGIFEKGSFVVLGKSGRIGTVKGICGIGRNYIMRAFEESGPRLEGEIRIRRMAVSAIPSSPGLRLVYRLLSRLIPFFLGSMLDFIDGGEDDKEEGFVEISAGSLGMLTSSSEIENADTDDF